MSRHTDLNGTPCVTQDEAVTRNFSILMDAVVKLSERVEDLEAALKDDECEDGEQ